MSLNKDQILSVIDGIQSQLDQLRKIVQQIPDQQQQQNPFGVSFMFGQPQMTVIQTRSMGFMGNPTGTIQNQSWGNKAWNAD